MNIILAALEPVHSPQRGLQRTQPYGTVLFQKVFVGLPGKDAEFKCTDRDLLPMPGSIRNRSWAAGVAHASSSDMQQRVQRSRILIAIKKNREQAKIEEVLKLCNVAIQRQVEQAKKGGFGMDDYTDGRTIGGASLARNILRVLHVTNTTL